MGGEGMSWSGVFIEEKWMGPMEAAREKEWKVSQMPRRVALSAH